MRKLLLILVIGGAVGWYFLKEEPAAKDKVMERVDDALNRRPNEELLDAVENTRDAAGQAAKEAKEAVRAAAEAVKDAAQ